MYEGKLVRLRELRSADAEKCYEWLNEINMAHKLYGGAPMPLTLENERDFVARFSGRKNDQNHFGIETLDGRFIGVCSYNNVSWINRNCAVGWFIGDSAMRGRGFGTDMMRVLLNICFAELDMHKVYLNVYGYNEGAVRLYERLGFVREGAYRESAYAMGRRWDEYRYSMLRTEYQALYGGEA
jgi:RimJ/RimL family protein N-acetyltransferase